MKTLIMCEGPHEQKIIEMLIDNDMLSITRDNLLGGDVFHARQIHSNATVRANINIYKGNITIFRIGDKQTDVLKIPPEYQKQIIDVKKYCTLPEIEILLIISEGLFGEYNKTKSSIHPKQFAKINIKCGKYKYDAQTQFYEDYFGNDINKLVNVVREYKKVNHSHKKDQLYIADLLK